MNSFFDNWKTSLILLLCAICKYEATFIYKLSAVIVCLLVVAFFDSSNCSREQQVQSNLFICFVCLWWAFSLIKSGDAFDANDSRETRYKLRNWGWDLRILFLEKSHLWFDWFGGIFLATVVIGASGVVIDLFLHSLDKTSLCRFFRIYHLFCNEFFFEEISQQ